MRKVVVCGATLAAACVSAVGVLPTGANADPADAEPVPGVSATTAPPPDLVPGESPATPAPPSEAPAPATPEPEPSARQAPDDDSVTSGSAVMVTPEPPAVRTYAYGSAARQRLDVYWRKPAKPPVDPQGRTAAAPKPAPGPAVLMLHGGYWLEGDKSGWKYFARRLTGQGFTVIAANYRLAPDAVWPAQRDDALTALGYVKKNAARWNIDPAKIVVMGSSAGGMLATQIGTAGEGADRVRGVVALSPVNNPYLAYRQGERPDATTGQRKLRGAVLDLIKCVPGSTDACWVRVEDASSATHATSGDAPMLLLHSVGDFVPVTHSTALASALRAVGVAANVQTVPGRAHGPSLMNDPQVYPRILKFLKDRTG